MYQYGLTWHDDIKRFTRLILQLKSATLSSRGMSNIRIIISQQARGSYQYKNINKGSIKGMRVVEYDMIVNVSCDLPFRQNQPLKSADD
jgi:hypothetical protein